MRLFAEPAPSLPRFKALLIQGVYPSSAPIHLCLSIPPGQRAILLSPTREVLLHSLESCGDDWLRSFSGTGVTSRISSRVRVFYPPKPKHLIALLTSLCCNSGAAITDGVDPPCLLVLHEPSAYFLQENGHDHYTISSYLLLIAHARALAQFFMSRNSNTSSTSLVVFDYKLDQLKLPVLQAPSKSVSDPGQMRDDAPRPEPVALFAKKYFDLIGTFQAVDAQFTLECNGKALRQ